MNQVRVGVIGVGKMGKNHCRIYASMRCTELMGICDLEPTRGNQIAGLYEVPFYHSLDELLDQVDAVSIVTPTPTHFDLAMQCLARGIHVLVEKPFTETVEQAEILTRLAETRGLVLQVGHTERFNPVYGELKHVLEPLSVLAIEMERLSPFEVSNKDTDVILDLMIHDIDVALDLVGLEPTSVSASGLTTYDNAVDHAIAYLRFDSFPLLTITASRVTEQKIRMLKVIAREAYLEGDFLNRTIAVHRRTIGEYLSHNHRSVKYRHESIVERIHVPALEPLYLELEHFAQCILEEKSPIVSGREGLRALRVALQIRDAIRANLIGSGAIQPIGFHLSAERAPVGLGRLKELVVG